MPVTGLFFFPFGSADITSKRYVLHDMYGYCAIHYSRLNDGRDHLVTLPEAWHVAIKLAGGFDIPDPLYMWARCKNN